MVEGTPFDERAPLAGLEEALRSVDLRWTDIERTAQEAVLFGSRAAGLARDTSDWDLLLVGAGPSVRTRDIDLLWIAPARLWSASWLGSELAHHIAVYGRWLFGAGAWRHLALGSPEAAGRKQAALHVQLARLRSCWPDLLPAARARHLRRLRRDVQRWRLLREGAAVPPAPVLDDWWRNAGAPREGLDDLVAELESGGVLGGSAASAWPAGLISRAGTLGAPRRT